MLFISLRKTNNPSGQEYEIKYFSRQNIEKEYAILTEHQGKSTIRGYLSYDFSTSNIRSDLDSRVNKDRREIDRKEKYLKTEVKTAEDISKSFDEIINLFYEIDKHKKDRKTVNPTFGSSARGHDSSNMISQLKRDFFVSKVEAGGQFVDDLSGVVNEFFGETLREGCGVIPLIDAFIQFNLHRGTDIVSSKDFSSACRVLAGDSTK